MIIRNIISQKKSTQVYFQKRINHEKWNDELFELLFQILLWKRIVLRYVLNKDRDFHLLPELLHFPTNSNGIFQPTFERKSEIFPNVFNEHEALTL